MARLQDRILALASPPVLQPTQVTRDDVIRHFGPERGESCWQEFAPKRLDRARADELNARLAAGWDDLRARIQAVTLGHARMTEVLAAAGAPLSPADLGWPAPLFDAAMRHARELRNRYTFLDFAADLAPATSP
jgi:glycerol-1-phosphate dehydrogenase [NAD(P)+]